LSSDIQSELFTILYYLAEIKLSTIADAALFSVVIGGVDSQA